MDQDLLTLNFSIKQGSGIPIPIFKIELYSNNDLIYRKSETDINNIGYVYRTYYVKLDKIIGERKLKNIKDANLIDFVVLITPFQTHFTINDGKIDKSLTFSIINSNENIEYLEKYIDMNKDKLYETQNIKIRVNLL